MNPPRLVAVACLLLVLLAFIGRILSNPEVDQPGVPSLAGTKIAYLAAQVPPIGDFDREFNVNLENPFVAIQARRDEKKAINEPKVAAPKNLPTPGPPVVVEAPRLVLPRAKAIDFDRPECLGVISHGRSGREVLIARLPGGEEQQLERGARLGEWELIDLLPRGARFRDPKGVEQDVPFVAPSPTTLLMLTPESAAPVNQPPAGEAPTSEAAVNQAPPAPAAPPQVRPAQPMRGGGGGDDRRPPQPRPAPDMVPKPPVK